MDGCYRTVHHPGAAHRNLVACATLLPVADIQGAHGHCRTHSRHPARYMRFLAPPLFVGIDNEKLRTFLETQPLGPLPCTRY